MTKSGSDGEREKVNEMKEKQNEDGKSQNF